MSNFESDGPSDNEWEDRGDLAWNEFDWERYLRDQDEVLLRYLSHYEKLKNHSARIDEVAHLMGWDEESWSSESENEPDADDASPSSTEGSEYEAEPYTLHKNPIFVATKSIYLSLKHDWERMADAPARVPQPLALAFHASLYRGEEQAMLAIQALDFGDYAMAISLFKRSLRELNRSFALLSPAAAEHSRSLSAFRDEAFPRLFDLREIWLRVMNECRDELERPPEEEDDEE